MKKLFVLLTTLIIISMVMACAQATPSPEATKEVVPTEPAAQPEATKEVIPTAPSAQPTEIVASKEVIELTLWHQESPPRRVDAFQIIIDRFNTENPGIQVKQAPQSWAEIYAKLYASIEAGNPPDMLFYLDSRILRVEPINDYLECIHAARG
jgi:ABC-type glycerol-3-phosphate transport system substrate-binding protein